MGKSGTTPCKMGKSGEKWGKVRKADVTLMWQRRKVGINGTTPSPLISVPNVWLSGGQLDARGDDQGMLQGIRDGPVSGADRPVEGGDLRDGAVQIDDGGDRLQVLVAGAGCRLRCRLQVAGAGCGCREQVENWRSIGRLKP
ncbi:hypothetical protein R6Q59_024034 [Mikania micrantha]